MALVDALDNFRLARPQRDLLSFAREQIGERSAPSAPTDDGDFHVPTRHYWLTVPPVLNLFSVPAISRAILRRCAKMISATSTTLAQSTSGACGWNSATESGTVSTAMIELSET